MSSSLPDPVLLDNTALSNFAYKDQDDLVMDLWSSCATTLEAWQEFQAGIKIGKLPKNAWKTLSLIELTATDGMFVTDDRKARQIAVELGVKVTGTLGILVVAVERQKITLKEANQLLTEMIERGYRSPVGDLSSYLSR